MAGTGKSCIGLVVKAFFAPEHIGIMSSNIEEKFGLMNLHDKHAFICFEVSP